MHARWALSAGHRMTTGEGESVRVVYPGIPAGSSGPDYKDAVVVFEQSGLVQGDVELHLWGHDWHRHGHDTDPAYDRVVLHVVGDPCSRTRTCLAGGRDVPMVVLDATERAREESALPCSGRAERETESLSGLLARAGIARLLSRAGRIVVEMVGIEPWKVLAHRSARALGYSANADALLELGWLLTSPGVLPLLSDSDCERRRVMVVGLAGLLPSQRPGGGLLASGDMPQWESWWGEVDGGAQSLSPRLWKMSGLYPNNSPVRRVVALADLWPRLERLAETALEQVIRRQERPRGLALWLEQQYRLVGTTYWRHHYDFGRRTRESDLVGGSKAREVVVNALLPFVTACAMASGDVSHVAAVARLLSAYPPAPAHAVTRHMQRQLGLARGGATAAVQQGMLHVYGEYCRRGLCARCPLGSEQTRVVLPGRETFIDASAAIC